MIRVCSCLDKRILVQSFIVIDFLVKFQCKGWFLVGRIEYGGLYLGFGGVGVGVVSCGSVLVLV